MSILRWTMAQAVLTACAALLLLAPDALCQPDTLWTSAISNGSIHMEVIQTRDGGYAIGGAAWDGDQERPDENFSLQKLDTLGLLRWREFYSPDTLEISDEVHGIEQLPDGGYILAGELRNVGALLRTDSTGAMLWWRCYDDFPMGFWDSALCDEDTHVVVVSGSGVALKIDTEDGEVIWQQNYSIQNSGIFYYVTCTRENGFLFNGWIASIGAGGSDIYAVKTDEDGEVEWRQAYGTEYSEGSMRAVQTADGGYCIGGYTNRGGGASRNTGMIVRIDSEGEEIWRNIFTTENDSIIWRPLKSIVETPDGGFAVLRNGDNHSALFGRLNSEGGIIWDVEYRIGGANSNSAFSLIRLDDFGFLMGGFAPGLGDWLVRTGPDSLSIAAWNLQAAEESHNFGEVTLDSTQTWDLTLTNAADYPVYVQSVTVDSAGFAGEIEKVWELEPGEEVSIQIAFTPAESREYSGSLTIHTVFRDLVIGLTGAGVPSYVPQDCQLPVEFAINTVCPNPFNAATTIRYSLPAAGRVRLGVYDMNGRMVMDMMDKMDWPGSHSLTLNAEGLAAGVYIVEMRAGGDVKREKAVVVR